MVLLTDGCTKPLMVSCSPLLSAVLLRFVLTMYASFTLLHTKNAADGYLINFRNDMAEMIRINPLTGENKHWMLSAPCETIRCEAELKRDEGYRLMRSIGLNLKTLVQ